MNDLRLQLDGTPLSLAVRRLVIAGFTGRDAASVREHIRELERHGVPPPATVPVFYQLDPQLLSTAKSFDVNSAAVSGEAEAVLVFPDHQLENALVAVGSDLTDRVLERTSIERSKLQPKPLGAQVWRLRDVRDCWDELQLTSWVVPDHKARWYQKGTLASLLHPEQILERLPPGVRGDLANTVLFLGTIPLCDAEFVFSDYFACELVAPGRGSLRCEYVLRNRSFCRTT
jgi:hypothetical protein